MIISLVLLNERKIGTCEKDCHKYHCVTNDLDCDAIKNWIRVRKKKPRQTIFGWVKFLRKTSGNIILHLYGPYIF